MRVHKFVLLFLAGLLIVGCVLYWAGTEDVYNQVLKLSFTYFLLFLAVQIAMMVLWALKWWIILRQHKISFWRLLPVSFFGYLMNNLSPMTMAGGEAFRAYMLGRVEKISTEDSAASVVIDLFLEVFPLMIMIVLSIFIVLTYDIPYIIAVILGLAGLFVLAVLLFILVLIVNERVSHLLITHAIRLMCCIPISFLRNHALDAKTRIDKILVNFQKTLRTSVKDNTVLFFGVIIASIIWFLSILRMYLIFQMLGVEIPLSAIVMVRVVITALTFLSVIPGGLGIWEGGSTWFYSLFGIAAPVAMAATLIERLFSFWIGSAIGFAATVYLGATKIVKKYLDE